MFTLDAGFLDALEGKAVGQGNAEGEGRQLIQAAGRGICMACLVQLLLLLLLLL